MKTKKINGATFEKMLRNGLNAIRAEEKRINELNVFPVPDGDTGTNMRLTLENGLKTAKSAEQSGTYLKALSEGMLLGARGNSGVILSRIFKGIFLELQHDWAVNSQELFQALVRGYKTAYEAVVRPVEGTILTVVREGAENIRGSVDRNISVEDLLSLYITEMKKSLQRTPELLRELKEAGVVDSGAEGYIVIVEGMLKALYGEIIEGAAPEESEKDPAAALPASEELFNENSAFEDGYCVEFILQLMNGGRYDGHFRESTFTEDLKTLGNSLVVIKEGRRVKVHIHTMKPGRILQLSQEYGEFLTMKIENMQIQHNEHIRFLEEKKAAHKRLAVIPVASGEGFREIFKGLGCDIVPDGGPTMNTSAEEFLKAYKAANADEILVLPNNKNVIRAALQAAEMFEGVPVHILETKSLAEGYYALAMDVPDSDDIEARINGMRSGMESIHTLQTAKTTRDYKSGELFCPKGTFLSMKDGEPVSFGDSPEDAVINALSADDDASFYETCLIFTGAGAAEEETEALAARISACYPMMNVTVLSGGQRIYPYILGVL